MRGIIRTLKFCISRNLTSASSFQVILLSVIAHSVISICLIYFHLNWYIDYQLSDFQPNEGLHGKQGGIQLARKRLELNLVTSDILESDSPEQQFNLRGWWSDHSRWDQEVSCFPQKWLLCTKVLSTKCKPDVIRSIYQYIAIKDKVTLQNIEVSLRSRTQNLQQMDGGINHFGLHALIESNDGSTNIAKMTFPVDSENWTRRSIKFSSKAGTRINSITIMLSCIGFTGSVSFTDIQVIPDLDINQWKSASDIVAQCPAQSASVAHGAPTLVSSSSMTEYSTVLLEQLSYQMKNVDINQITLGTHVSLDRLAMLEKNLVNWNGPVSLAIFVPVKTLASGLDDWQRVYIDKKMKSLNLTSGSSVTLLLASTEATEDAASKVDTTNDSSYRKTPHKYPINKLRNIVIKNTYTKHVLLVDADFAPSENIDHAFKSTLQYFPECSGKDQSKCLFIVPAFEWLHFDQPLPKITSKANLVSMILKDDPDIVPFQMFEAPQSHQLTNYFKWYSSSSAYHVRGFGDKFEPYFIARKNSLPLFNEAFEGYGMNKITHVLQLFASGYQFIVLPDAWIIHMPHKTSANSIEFLQSPIERLTNRFLRFKYTHSLAFNYSLPSAQACN